MADTFVDIVVVENPVDIVTEIRPIDIVTGFPGGYGLPSGGTTGNLIAKDSAADGDVSWQPPSAAHAHAIGAHSDVGTATPTDTHVLIGDGAEFASRALLAGDLPTIDLSDGTNATVSAPITLTGDAIGFNGALVDLSDVSAATPTNKHGLFGNGSSFVSRLIQTTDLSGCSVFGLSDVKNTLGTLTTGHMLRYDFGTGAFEAIAVGLTDLTGQNLINDLDNVGTAVVATDHLLKYDGVKWANGFVDYTDLTNTPSTFAPSAHTHDASDITGTIDVSGQTDLAVSAPITLTGDTVGLDLTADYVWTGYHKFTAIDATDNMALLVDPDSQTLQGFSKLGQETVVLIDGSSGLFTGGLGFTTYLEDPESGNINYSLIGYTTVKSLANNSTGLYCASFFVDLAPGADGMVAGDGDIGEVIACDVWQGAPNSDYDGYMGTVIGVRSHVNIGGGVAAGFGAEFVTAYFGQVHRSKCLVGHHVTGFRSSFTGPPANGTNTIGAHFMGADQPDAVTDDKEYLLVGMVGGNIAIIADGDGTGHTFKLGAGEDAKFWFDGTDLQITSPADIVFNTGTKIDVNGDLVVQSYNNAGRPSAGTAGRIIFNTDDGQLNVDDGTDWTLPDGTTT